MTLSRRAYAWSWSDYAAVRAENPPPLRRIIVHGGQRRARGTLSRFLGTSNHASQIKATLSDHHPAIINGRTRFLKSVVSAASSPRLFLSGEQNAKLGKRSVKGPWRGMPIFQLSLEERATCPASCKLWSECYGNAMPFARRHEHGPELEARIVHDVQLMAMRYPGGFIIRLHVLGDFYSERYAGLWSVLADRVKALRIFGYTAHSPDSAIGSIITGANQALPDRFKIRFSVAADAPPAVDQTTVIWRQARGKQPEGIVCPAQTDGADNCSTCGLCWNPAAADKRIVFIGHGMNYGGRAA